MLHLLQQLGKNRASGESVRDLSAME